MSILQALAGIFWGPPMAAAFLAVGFLLTLRLHGVQFLHAGAWLREAIAALSELVSGNFGE